MGSSNHHNITNNRPTFPTPPAFIAQRIMEYEAEQYKEKLARAKLIADLKRVVATHRKRRGAKVKNVPMTLKPILRHKVSDHLKSNPYYQRDLQQSIRDKHIIIDEKYYAGHERETKYEEPPLSTARSLAAYEKRQTQIREKQEQLHAKLDEDLKVSNTPIRTEFYNKLIKYLFDNSPRRYGKKNGQSILLGYGYKDIIEIGIDRNPNDLSKNIFTLCIDAVPVGTRGLNSSGQVAVYLYKLLDKLQKRTLELDPRWNADEIEFLLLSCVSELKLDKDLLQSCRTMARKLNDNTLKPGKNHH